MRLHLILQQRHGRRELGHGRQERRHEREQRRRRRWERRRHASLCAKAFVFFEKLLFPHILPFFKNTWSL